MRFFVNLLFQMMVTLPVFMEQTTAEATAAGASPVTIVTAYFNFDSRSKHSTGSYDAWTAFFIGRVESPSVIYTDLKSHAKLREMRGAKTTAWKLYSDVWGLPCGYKKDEIERQHSLDPEQHIHYPELYMVWNAKPCMVAIAVRENVFSSQFFFWVDIGSFRSDHNLRYWPDLARVHSVDRDHNSSVILGLIAPFPPEFKAKNRTQQYIVGDYVEGTFFGGRAAPLLWWAHAHKDKLTALMQAGKFVGKDQSIMNTVAADNQDKVIALHSYKASCWNLWFYFQQYFASKEEMAAECSQMPDVLDAL